MLTKCRLVLRPLSSHNSDIFSISRCPVLYRSALSEVGDRSPRRYDLRVTVACYVATAWYDQQRVCVGGRPGRRGGAASMPIDQKAPHWHRRSGGHSARRRASLLLIGQYIRWFISMPDHRQDLSYLSSFNCCMREGRLADMRAKNSCEIWAVTA